MSGSNCLAATTRTDRFARNVMTACQKSAEGIVGGMQTGEGLEALQSERRSKQINRTVVPSKA